MILSRGDKIKIQDFGKYQGTGGATKTDKFWEKFQRAGGSFSIQKFISQILDLYKGIFSDVLQKKLQYNFPKMTGGIKGCLEFF